jgi:hypothetical protein
MADGPVRFVGNLVDDLNIINVSKYGRDFSIIAVPYAFKLLMQELQTMNIKMRLITEDNVERLMSLTKGDDIEKLSGNKFVNVEQIQNEVNKILSKDNKLYPDANAELTPTPEYDWFDDAQEKVNKVIDGTSVNIPDLDEEEYEPISPTYGPTDGDSPLEDIKLPTEETGFRNFDVVKNTKKQTPEPEQTLEQIPEYGEEGFYRQEYNKEQAEELTDDVGVNYDRVDLGNASEAKEEEADKIIKTVSSINDQKTEGLELLLPEEEKEEEEKDTTETKKIKKIA